MACLSKSAAFSSSRLSAGGSRNRSLTTGSSKSAKVCPNSTAFAGNQGLRLGRGVQRVRRKGLAVCAAIRIDRRLHLEQQFRRQMEEDARAAEAEMTCPVDCVEEVRTLAQLQKVLAQAEDNDELVVVDFYNSACGACKYILPQVVRLCKSGGGCRVDGGSGVRFLKHNVRDEYDDLTDIAQFYGVKAVPRFSFFQDGARMDKFISRDKPRLGETIDDLLARKRELDAREE